MKIPIVPILNLHTRTQVYREKDLDKTGWSGGCGHGIDHDHDGRDGDHDASENENVDSDNNNIILTATLQENMVRYNFETSRYIHDE